MGLKLSRKGRKRKWTNVIAMMQEQNEVEHSRKRFHVKENGFLNDVFFFSLRYIMDFDCGEPFEKDGMEWVLVTIKGASFMLHQIRKMVGLCIAVMQGFASEAVFEKVFRPSRVDVPIAPGLGLMLEKVITLVSSLSMFLDFLNIILIIHLDVLFFSFSNLNFDFLFPNLLSISTFCQPPYFANVNRFLNSTWVNLDFLLRNEYLCAGLDVEEKCLFFLVGSLRLLRRKVRC
jgi:hypothetical protein